ncbi:MAG: GYD domain-containing protein [Armatimonadota bacterium]|nr:MAG: GYD domain-containing protein [Armatimonadota bacterium]
MPTYISLVNITEQGVQDAKSISRRVEQTRQLFEGFGVTLKELYLVTGQYDYVAIADAPDDETAAAAILSLASRGNVRTQTFRAFDAEETARIVSKIK